MPSEATDEGPALDTPEVSAAVPSRGSGEITEADTEIVGVGPVDLVALARIGRLQVSRPSGCCDGKLSLRSLQGSAGKT